MVSLAMIYSVLTDLGILIFVAGAGALGGWIARTLFLARLRVEEGGGDTEEILQAQEVLAQIQKLAGQVAADVGQHTHRVETINQELHSAGKARSEVVVVRAISQLLEANTQMRHKLASAEHQLQEQAKQIQTHLTAARTDALTGLANRRAFDEELARCYAAFQHHQRDFVVMMLDVDHFKKFNDAYGHQAGDEVLRGVAQALQKHSRSMDMVARYGGEEFALICPGASADRLKDQAERLRQAVESIPFRFGEQEVHVTASFGLAHLLPKETPANLLQRADTALYMSKQAGRNCVHWHDGQKIHRYCAIESPNSSSVDSTDSPPQTPLPQGQEATSLEDPSFSTPSGLPGKNQKGEAASEEAILPQPLESLHTRTEFCVVLGRRLAEWQRTKRPLSVLLLQVDRYLELVSQVGLQAAQLTLRATSQFLQAALRQMDVIAQYDNSTFALLMPETDLAQVADIGERLRQAISQCKLPLGNSVERITISLGAAEATDRDDLEGLLNRCEEALEQARSMGGNRVCLHTGQGVEPLETLV